MRLLDKPYTRFEKEEARRMLDGCIARVCVSDDELEITRMVGFACSCISMLAQSRIMQLREEKNGVERLAESR